MPKIRTVTGHDHILSELERDMQADNVAHAYIFAGPAHVGKRTVAHWFASQLVLSDCSPEERDTKLAEYEHLTHPDILVLDTLWIEGVSDDWNELSHTSNAPQQHRSKAPKAKTNTISIDDIRALQERLYETGTGKFRCCIITSVERMQDAAANAFLKILEEPPQGLVFLLTTQALSSLLPTILSRARVLRFSRLPNEHMRSIIPGASQDDAQFILSIAQGAPGLATLLHDDPDLLREHKTVQTQARDFWRAGNLQQRLSVLKPMKDRGEEADRLLLHLAIALRDQPNAGHTQALTEYARILKSNAHRGLASQQFALALE